VFGDLSASRVATLGLNPSNREFVDEFGNELEGASRRFHTLASLGLASWSDVDAGHLQLILESCRQYFFTNPYDRWFRRLDQVVAGAKASYYGPACGACHLDVSPYATGRKWTELTTQERSALLAAGGNTLGLLLRDSPVRMLILNGRSVVQQFESIAAISLASRREPAWTLPRKSAPSVAGFSYEGIVNAVAGIALGRDVMVIGFNHNIQSSFGVTSELIRAIRDRVSRVAKKAIR
jgi:hypothetical protein